MRRCDLGVALRWPPQPTRYLLDHAPRVRPRRRRLAFVDSGDTRWDFLGVGPHRLESIPCYADWSWESGGLLPLWDQSLLYRKQGIQWSPARHRGWARCSGLSTCHLALQRQWRCHLRWHREAIHEAGIGQWQYDVEMAEQQGMSTFAREGHMCVGEFGFDEIHEISFLGALNLRRSGIENLRSPEVANLWRSGILNLRSPEVANLRRSGIFNLRSSDVANLRRSGILNLRSPRVENLWRSGISNLRSPEVANLRRSGTGICEIQESTEDKIWRLWCMEVSMDKRLANRLETKSKTLPQKSEFGVWTSGRLVIVWV
jgi:hypothetical protein